MFIAREYSPGLPMTPTRLLSHLSSYRESPYCLSVVPLAGCPLFDACAISGTHRASVGVHDNRRIQGVPASSRAAERRGQGSGGTSLDVSRRQVAVQGRLQSPRRRGPASTRDHMTLFGPGSHDHDHVSRSSLFWGTRRVL